MVAQPRKVRLSFRKRSTGVENGAHRDWRFATTGSPPVASGRLRSPPAASGRLRSTSLAWRVPDGGGVSPGAAWVGLVWVCGEIAARKRVCVLNSLHWVVTTLAGADGDLGYLGGHEEEDDDGGSSAESGGARRCSGGSRRVGRAPPKPQNLLATTRPTRARRLARRSGPLPSSFSGSGGENRYCCASNFCWATPPKKDAEFCVLETSLNAH